MKPSFAEKAAAWRAEGWRVLALLGLAAAAGVIAGVLTAVFGHGVLAATALRERWPLLLVLLPAGGAAICAVYARWGGECGRGMALVFDAAAGRRDKVPARLVPLAVGATWLGHLLGASVGREGVAVQIAAAGASLLTPGLQAPRDKRRLLIAGVAAGFAGLFRTPLAATLFALELFHTGVAQYDALLPAAVAALTASAVSGALGVRPAAVALGAEAPAFTVETLIALAVLGAALAYAAVFAAGTNTLASPILVGLELFGGEYFGSFFLVCVMAYACNGGHSIYPQTPLEQPQ